MAELASKFKGIIQDLEKNVKNKEDMEYIRTQIYSIITLFLDQLDKVVDLTSDRMEELAQRQVQLNTKIEKMEGIVNHIEKDIYIDEEEESEFEVVCPYCNKEFIVDFSSELRSEITCPECHNVIELDWNDEENHSCDGHCSCCESGCEEEDDFEEDEKDDM